MSDSISKAEGHLDSAMAQLDLIGVEANKLFDRLAQQEALISSLSDRATKAETVMQAASHLIDNWLATRERLPHTLSEALRTFYVVYVDAVKAAEAAGITGGANGT